MTHKVVIFPLYHMDNNEATFDDIEQIGRYLRLEVYNPRLGNYDYNSHISFQFLS